MKQLELKKPLVVLDLETTGTSVTKDKIVQIAGIKLYVDGAKEKKMMYINPETHISQEATDVHGITDEMVKDAPTFLQIAKAFSQWLFGCDFCGYNSNSFDIPMLREEFNRANIVFPDEKASLIDVFKIEQRVNSRKLSETFKRYTGEELTDAHDALADTEATLEILLHQITNNDLGASSQELDDFGQDGIERVDLSGKLAKNDNGEIIYTFGKPKGKRVVDDKGFGEWMLKNDFASDTKEIIKSLLKK